MPSPARKVLKSKSTYDSYEGVRRYHYRYTYVPHPSLTDPDMNNPVNQRLWKISKSLADISAHQESAVGEVDCYIKPSEDMLLRIQNGLFRYRQHAVAMWMAGIWTRASYDGVDVSLTKSEKSFAEYCTLAEVRKGYVLELVRTMTAQAQKTIDTARSLVNTEYVADGAEEVTPELLALLGTTEGDVQTILDEVYDKRQKVLRSCAEIDAMTHELATGFKDVLKAIA